MKIGVLQSVGHNLADSFASGIGLLIGYYQMDVFGEAAKGPEGYIEIDFLSGATKGSAPSDSLCEAVRHYSHALADLCERHNCAAPDFSELTVKFFTYRFQNRFSEKRKQVRLKRLFFPDGSHKGQGSDNLKITLPPMLVQSMRVQYQAVQTPCI